MRIDAHQHFWHLANPFTDWPTPDLAAIHRDFGPDELAPLLEQARIDGTVAVQAAPKIAETEYLLALADTAPMVRAVVGWIDFAATDAIDQLRRLSSHHAFRGVRPMLQSIDEPSWILRPEFGPVFEAMIELDLRFDGLVHHGQIAQLSRLAGRYPELRIVLDHGGKPDIAAQAIAQWSDDVAELGSMPNVSSKLSGLWTEAGGNHARNRIEPYVQRLIDSFGPSRLMWGSDWPVVGLAGAYSDWLDQCEAMLSALSADDRAMVFGGTAAEFYGIGHA